MLTEMGHAKWARQAIQLYLYYKYVEALVTDISIPSSIDMEND